ncbi:Fic family protein [Candidatus Kaiserbacteria bacterium]|nr:Fic family protein [Candidatus Kaiserbacteria bacterium]
MRDIKDIPQPSFGSDLNTAIVELEKLRDKPLRGSTPPHAFYELKHIFQTLESLGSSRIEGNRTTVSEFAEKIIENIASETDESMMEINNIDKAITFLEKNVSVGTPITEEILCNAHKILVEGLTPSNGDNGGEGSRTPGQYRKGPVSIMGSKVTTSNHLVVPELIQELLVFINDDYATQYHLLVMALAHHRMTVIHPFDNGNGRLVRLLTYAQLLQQGFSVKSGRILNPTAVFCDNREQYYDMLSQADTWTDEGLLSWCRYVLEGLEREIQKIDHLLNRDYLESEILSVVLDRAKRNQYITEQEHKILYFVVNVSEDMLLRSADLVDVLGVEQPVARTRIINRMIEKKLIRPLEDGGRIYKVSYTGNYLFRELTQLLIEKNFVPESLNKN